MPTVAELGTNFNLPNYHGRVIQLTPSDTPLSTAIMATAPGGGEVETARTFEWQTYDLRSAGQRTVVDGDRTGTPQHRSRGNVFNVLQTHREDVDVAYERLSQYGQFDGQNIAGMNPVVNEEAFQIEQMWKQIKRDIEWSLLNGKYVLPSDNTTPAQTRGLNEAITTNRMELGDSVGTDANLVASSDNVEISSHGLSNGDQVAFYNVTDGDGIEEDRGYFVVSSATNTFKVATTVGGTPVDITANGTADVVKLNEFTEYDLGTVMQSAWDNGGLQESAMGVVIVNSTPKRWLSKLYVKDKGLETRSRSVGGVNVETIITDFGELGVMLNRYQPQHRITVASLDQLVPHFRAIPEKGIMFAEPTAKQGASNATQLYTSIGLEYGNEASHAILDNVTIAAPAPVD